MNLFGVAVEEWAEQVLADKETSAIEAHIGTRWRKSPGSYPEALFELARFMGTSVEQIDRTYGHVLPDSLDRARRALDDFASRPLTKTETQRP